MKKVMFGFLMFIFFLAGSVFAQNFEENSMEVLNKAKGEWQQAGDQTEIKSGDKIRIPINSTAEVTIHGLSVMRLAPNSEITLDKIQQEENSRKTTSIKLDKGDVWVNMEEDLKGLDFKIKTDVAGMVVKGTIFRVVRNRENQTILKVYQGEVECTNTKSNKVNLIKEYKEIIIDSDGEVIALRTIDKNDPLELSQWAVYNRQKDEQLKAIRELRRIEGIPEQKPDSFDIEDSR